MGWPARPPVPIEDDGRELRCILEAYRFVESDPDPKLTLDQSDRVSSSSSRVSKPFQDYVIITATNARRRLCPLEMHNCSSLHQNADFLNVSKITGLFNVAGKLHSIPALILVTRNQL